MHDYPIEVPEEWHALGSLNLGAPVLIIGQVDTGKSTLARYLYLQAAKCGEKVAYIDADLGQQIVGPPGTVTMALPDEKEEGVFPPNGARFMRFIGSNTPRGHFVPLLLALQKLQQRALEADIRTIIVDTSGFINPLQGAAVLKWAKVELLQPALVAALQKERELEPILAPLRRLLGKRIRVVRPAAATRERSTDERRAHRAEKYRAYFQDAQPISFSFRRLAVFPQRTFAPGQLLSLNDETGFALALGIVEREEPENQAIWIRTPWWGEGKVASLYLGALKVDLDTFQDEPL